MNFKQHDQCPGPCPCPCPSPSPSPSPSLSLSLGFESEKEQVREQGNRKREKEKREVTSKQHRSAQSNAHRTPSMPVPHPNRDASSGTSDFPPSFIKASRIILSLSLRLIRRAEQTTTTGAEPVLPIPGKLGRQELLRRLASVGFVRPARADCRRIRSGRATWRSRAELAVGVERQRRNVQTSLWDDQTRTRCETLASASCVRPVRGLDQRRTARAKNITSSKAPKNDQKP